MAGTQPPKSAWTPDPLVSFAEVATPPAPTKQPPTPPTVFRFACGVLTVTATRLRPDHWDLRVLLPLDEQTDALACVVSGLRPPLLPKSTPETIAAALACQTLDRCASGGAMRIRRDQFFQAVAGSYHPERRQWDVEPLEEQPPDLAPLVVVPTSTAATVDGERARREKPLTDADGRVSAFDRSLTRDRPQGQGKRR